VASHVSFFKNKIGGEVRNARVRNKRRRQWCDKRHDVGEKEYYSIRKEQR
jgi:hypothetical protein